jgi:hypothetical protein
MLASLLSFVLTLIDAQDETDLVAKHSRMMLHQGMLNAMIVIFSTTAQIYTGRQQTQSCAVHACMHEFTRA